MDTAYMGITLNLQKQYNKVNELQELTKQMTECLQRNDMFSFRMLVRMRGKVMIELGSLDITQEEMLKTLTKDEETRARKALTLEVDATQLENIDLRRMNEIYSNIKRNLKNTIYYDKAISLKIGGDSSFYKQ